MSLHSPHVSNTHELMRGRTGAPTPLKLRSDSTDQLLLARLSLSPENTSDDPELITVLASLPANETTFEYLGGCWKRERAERYKLVVRKVGLQTCAEGTVLTVRRRARIQWR